MKSRRPGGFFRAGVQAALLLALFSSAAPPAQGEDTLDLKKAVKIGSGRVMVIEFTDPDCPFCRKAEAYFRGKPQVTRYLFFVPLASHPASKAKVQYILSARDRAAAYGEVMAGRFGPDRQAEITPEGVRLQKEHQEISRDNGMKATPTFMIYGRIVRGLDLKTLEPLLK